MHITKLGNPQKGRGEFLFRCKKCGCEWYADRSDKELKISPPCCEFYVYMNCPSCKSYTEAGK